MTLLRHTPPNPWRRNVTECNATVSCDRLTVAVGHLGADRDQKNPRAHKNKIGLPPPPPNLKYPPPPKRGTLWTWRFSCRKNAEILGVHKIGAAISGPRIADKNFMDTRIFLKRERESE